MYFYHFSTDSYVKRANTKSIYTYTYTYIYMYMHECIYIYI